MDILDYEDLDKVVEVLKFGFDMLNDLMVV